MKPFPSHFFSKRSINVKYHGFDINPDFIEHAKTKHPKHNFKVVNVGLSWFSEKRELKYEQFIQGLSINYVKSNESRDARSRDRIGTS